MVNYLPSYKLGKSIIHCYLNFGKIVWVRVTRERLKKLVSKQKQALRLTENDDSNIIEIIKMKISKKNESSICQVLNFIHRIKINIAPITFYNHFNEINY